MKSVKGVILVLMVFMLTACGSKEVLLTAGDLEVTDKDYIDMFNDYVYKTDRQGMILEKVASELASEKEVDKLYEKTIEQLEKIYGDEDGLTEEDRENVRTQSELEVGIAEIYTKTGVVTDEEIEKSYGKGKNEYIIKPVTVEGGNKKEVKKVKEILKSNKDVDKKLDKLGEGVTYSGSTAFNDYTLPMEFEGVKGTKKGSVGTEDLGGATFIYLVEDVKKVDLDEIKQDIVLSLGGEKELDSESLFEKLEKEGYIKMTKDLREYLQLDEDKVK